MTLVSRWGGYSYSDGSRAGCLRIHLFLYRSRSQALRSGATAGGSSSDEQANPQVTPTDTVSMPKVHWAQDSSEQRRPVSASTSDGIRCGTSITNSSPP